MADDTSGVPRYFFASAHFGGEKKGYIYKRDEFGMGYYRDDTGRRRSRGEYMYADENDDDDDDGSHEVKRRKGIDGEALLRDAEEHVAREESSLGRNNSDVSDAKSLRRTLKILRKKYDENCALRAKFGDSNPQKFLESEVSLATELRRLAAVAALPSLFFVLLEKINDNTVDESFQENILKSKCIEGTVFELMMLLLSHENTDIAGEAVSLLREITDLDALLGCGQEDGSGPVEEDESALNLNTTAKRVLSGAGACTLPLIANLSRMDENVEAELLTVNNIIAFIDNIVEVSETSIIDEIVTKSKLMRWLLFRIRVTSHDSHDKNSTLVSVDGTKAAAADLLAGLLQISENARKSLKQNGIESMLISLSRFRKNIEKDEESLELLESLTSGLCSAMLDPQNRLNFSELDGVELLLLMMKVKNKLVRTSALKLMDFALTRNVSGCERLMCAPGGIGMIFSIFMSKMKYLSSKGDEEEENIKTRSVSIIFTLFCSIAPGNTQGDRLAAKMVENEYEKCDRLIELYFEYKDQIKTRVKALHRHAKATGDIISESDIHSSKMEGGQYSLQQIAYIIGQIYSTKHAGIQSRLLMLLEQHNETLKDVRCILDTYWYEIGDADGDEDQQKRRERLRLLQNELIAPEEKIENDSSQY